jgi:ribosomal protein S18 acetylase RimI-like enzyme
MKSRVEPFPIEVRPARGNDLKGIFRCDPFAGQDAHRRDFIENAFNVGGCHVAVSSEIVGFAILEYSFFENGFISLLVVHPNFHRREIGTRLVQYLEKICKTGKIFTSTNQSNLPMQALLAKMEYLFSGEIFGLDADDPELIFRKELGQ